MSDSKSAEGKTDKMIYYTVRFPIEWEQRILVLQKAMSENKPADLLNISTASVIRQAFKIGLDRLSKKYEA
jgi:hypothetical protein